MTRSVRRRADRLASLHRELAGLIRAARGQRDRDLFDGAAPDIKSREAAIGPRTVTLSLREAFDLFRAALPPSARDVTTRKSHALLFIALRHFLDTLHAIDNAVPSPASIAAAEVVGRQVRTWLRQAERARDKEAAWRAGWIAREAANYPAPRLVSPARPRARSPRPVKAQGTLLLPLNTIGLLRHDSPGFRDPVPVCSEPRSGLQLPTSDIVEAGSQEMTSVSSKKRSH